jgi:hypothetical protein
LFEYFAAVFNNVFRLSDIGLGFPPTPPTPIKRFAQGVVNLNDFLEILGSSMTRSVKKIYKKIKLQRRFVGHPKIKPDLLQLQRRPQGFILMASLRYVSEME